MKIKLVEVFVYKYNHHYRLGGHTDTPNRLQGTDYYFEPQWQHAYSRLLESCLVKITTNTGLVGWGEGQAPLVPEVPATLIAKLMGPAILGMDPTEPEIIYNKLYHLNHVRGHTASYTIDAITAIDIALWDIKGKVENKPLNKILGKKVNLKWPLYISGLRRAHLEERKQLAREKIQEGFKGIKIFKGDTAEKTILKCEAILLAIGNAELAFDAICRHNYKTALKIGQGLDNLQASWFESPINPEDISGHAKLAGAINKPLAIGEPLRTVQEFQPWLEQKAMKIAQPDIVRCGITGGNRIIDTAQQHNLRIAPHIGVCTAIGVAATWHVTSAIPEAESQEHQYDLFETANNVLMNPLEVKNGEAIVPSQPGLGIEVNEESVIANSRKRWRVINEE